MGASAAGGDPFSPLDRRYPDGLVNQDVGAELIAARWGLSRSELDDFAATSHDRAAAAARGASDAEIVPVQITDVDGATKPHIVDETIRAGRRPTDS